MDTAPATNKIRILLVDDDEDDFVIFKSLLAKITSAPFKIEWTNDPKRAEDLINQQAHDIYVVDYRLGSQNGLELLAKFDLVQREQPFIILTGAGDEYIERQAMRAGIADYLVKGTFDAGLLSRVLRYALQRKKLEAHRVQQLIDLNRSKDEFIALTSHQLRTPATAVKQYVGMILEGFAGNVTNEQRELLQSAYESNDRQIQIVNDILRVARLDLKKIKLKKDAIDVTAMVQNLMHDFASQFSARNQHMRMQVAPEHLYARADEEYVRMAIANIIDNASKYTPDGKHITLAVSAKGRKVQVAITDEGVGIAAEDMGKLFKKLSRIDNPLSIKVGGTGLGLYWAHSIVEQLGGSIEVTSALGKGTTFTVILPKTTRK